MARRNIVVSALHALTSDEFEPYNFSNNATLHEFVTEYFTNGSDEMDDDVSSDEEEMRTFTEIKLTVIQHSLLLHIDWMNTASYSAAINSSEAVDEGVLYHTTLTFT